MNSTNNSWPLRYWLSVASLMLSCICKSHAATLQVPADYPAIQAAVDAARNGDTIILARGSYAGTVDFKGKSLTLRSDFIGEAPSPEDVAQTIIEGNTPGLPVINASSNGSILIGFTVRNGTSSGVLFSGYGRLQDVVSEGNSVWGFHISSSQRMDVKNCVARRNLFGGMFCRFVDVSISGLQSIDNANGLWIEEGVALVSDSVISNNSNGGLIMGGNILSVKVFGCTIAYNAVAGISSHQGAGSTYVGNSIVWGNGGSLVTTSSLFAIKASIVQGGKSGTTATYDRLMDYGADNIVADPKFVAPSTGDFRLRDDSPAIGAGGPVPIGINGARSAEPPGSALDLGGVENARAFPAVNSFAVFGVLTHNLCAGDRSGEILLQVANGIEPLGYSWTGPDNFTSTVKDLSGLPSGAYRVVVSGGGKFATNTFNVREPSPLTLASTVCGQFPNVKLSLTPGGGTPPYMVKWDGGGMNSKRLSGLRAPTV